MIVIADTGPLRYLILLGEVELLPALYAGVAIPSQVHNELQQDATPEVVRQWMARPPAWLSIEQAPESSVNLDLDIGEAAAIQLAHALKADLIVMDDKKGRAVARQQGLATIGTLGVLRDAAVRGLIDFPASISHLQELGFYMSEELIAVIQRDFPAHDAGAS